MARFVQVSGCFVLLVLFSGLLDYQKWSKHCVFIKDLTTSVIDYLIKIRVINEKNQHLYSFTESELIFNRISHVVDIERSNLKICPTHRYDYGIGWFVPRKCAYRLSTGQCCNSESDRVAPMHLLINP